MTTRKHPASDDDQKHTKHGPRAVPHDHTAVHVPKMGKGRPKPKPVQGEAAAVPAAPAVSAPAEPAERNVPVKITSALAGLPPPGHLPSATALPQAPAEQTPAAPAVQTLAPTAPAVAPIVPSAPAESGDDADASHTKMLLVIFLVTLLGGGAAIAYFLMSQETNPLEGLF
ncbi:MAG: hypothetical protein G01um101425_1019 [Candidatus Peregrinibacteria bacterium Gr01-1014_25]|nr:MAG: hypothetical protein G01um101425_1019 [Candidatus Peregrinibacteria bacterium Gr01-1014_25]